MKGLSFDRVVNFVSAAVVTVGVCLIVSGMTGCNAGAVAADQEEYFVTVYQSHYYDIVYDSYTKVMYTETTKAAYGTPGILTVMVDSDGTPLLYTGSVASYIQEIR